MKLTRFLVAMLTLAPTPLLAQGISTSNGLAQVSGIVIGSVISGSCTTGYNLFNNGGVVGCQANGGGTIAFPVTVTGGTSGGIPYFSATTTLSASGLLGSGQIVLGGGAGSAPTSDASATLSAGALSLGASGTAGSVLMGNATSGTVTLQPVTGALGTVTASLPANTGTIAETNFAQAWTAAQTFPASGILLKDSSTGVLTFAYDTSTANSTTVTIPYVAATDTVATLGASNVFTGANSHTAQDNFTPIANANTNGQLSSTTFTWAVGSAQVSSITLTGGTSYTFANPTGLVSGGTYILNIIEPTSGGAATVGSWGSSWKFPSGTKPTLSYTVGNAYPDALTCYSPDGTVLNCVFQGNFQ